MKEAITPLPLRKRLAVERLGFGLLNKVVLRFPINFWRAAIGNQDLFFGRAQKVPPGAQPCDRQEMLLQDGVGERGREWGAAASRSVQWASLRGGGHAARARRGGRLR